MSFICGVDMKTVQFKLNLPSDGENLARRGGSAQRAFPRVAGCFVLARSNVTASGSARKGGGMMRNQIELIPTPQLALSLATVNHLPHFTTFVAARAFRQCRGGEDGMIQSLFGVRLDAAQGISEAGREVAAQPSLCTAESTTCPRVTSPWGCIASVEKSSMAFVIIFMLGGAAEILGRNSAKPQGT